MLSSQIIARLESIHQFFSNATECLAEEDSKFSPKEGMHTVAQHVAEVAHTIDWFVEGAFGDKGFDLDFDAGQKKIMGFKSLTKARRKLDKAIDRAVKAVEGKTDGELLRLLPAESPMEGQPIETVFWAITDHTAHHRGVLAVYARLLGKSPRIPYLDE
jgi:uncharacterized damage-inducible protein DinB